MPAALAAKAIRVTTAWVLVPNGPMAARVEPSPPSSGVVGGVGFFVTLVVTPTGVSASGAYARTLPRERETEPDHPDPEDEMQEVVGSVDGHKVGRRFLADDEPVHEQH